MLGFRRNPLSRRKKSTSSEHSYASDRSIDDVITTAENTRPSAMVTPSSSSLNKHVIQEETKRNGDAASLSSNEVTTHTSSQSRTQSSSEVRTMSSSNFRTASSGQIQSSSSSSSSSSWLRGVSEMAQFVKSKIVRELEDVPKSHFEKIDLETYLEYIGDERLIHMPSKGSQWDRVLKEAEFFGIQLDDFASNLRQVIPEWQNVRNTALASCYLLLELGCDQAEALEPTFNAFYELGLLLAHTIRLHEMFSASDAIKSDLSRIFSNLVHLIGDVAVFYRQRISRLYSGSVTIDFDAEFGSQISEIWSLKEHLFNHMWAYKLRSKQQSLDIATLRQHLLPSKESVKSFVYGRVADRKLRVDGTCEWIQHDLGDFLGGEDDIFTITGNEGCGKSMLAAWVRQRLERPINRAQFETISYTFSSDIPEESSPIGLLKSFLSQLLETNVGDVDLFERLGVIFDRTPPGENSHKLETDLWESLELSLAAINKRTNLVLVIDGLDEITGGTQKAGDLHKRLHTALKKHSNIQAVTFSRPISHLGGSGCKHLVITPDHIRDDIELFLANRLRRNATFAAENDQSKRNMINQLADQAKGSFLHAYLSINLLSTGLNFNTFRDTIAQCKSDVKLVIGELMKKVNLKEEYGESKTYNLFIYMIAAQRPLTTGEMTDLMGVSISKRSVSPSADIWGPINNTQGLVVVHRGTLRFKHSVVRKYVHSLCGNALMSIEDTHRHLTMALMLFAKTKFTHSYEPSLEPLTDDVVQDCFHSHHIVRYMMQHWVSHFRSSSLHDQKGKLTLTAEFKECFPESTFFSLLEWSHWQTQFPLKTTIEMHDLSLRIRSTCLGEKHRSYLQNLIVLGSLHRRTNDQTCAAEFFYKASCIGQVVLYKFSPLVISCTNSFLACTEKITITTRTTTVTYREEMIKYMIEMHKAKSGKTSDAVIQWHKALAKLYIDIKEEESAMELYRELHAIVTLRFGKGSKMESEIAEEVSGMTIDLRGKGGNNTKLITRHTDLLFDAAEEMSYTDIRRIKIIMSLARTYESEKKFLMTERLYVSLWRSILEVCREKSTTEFQIEKLNIAIEYIHFLKRIKRNEEACNILVCLWAEYEHHTFESEVMAIRFKQLAVIAKSFGIVNVSMSMLNRVWGYFKSKKNIEHEEALSTVTIMTEVVEEVIETTVQTKTTTTVVETVTKEVWETTYNRCKGGKVNKGFFSSCVALVNLYLRQENWAEAEIITRKSLELSWGGVLTADSKLTIEGEFVSERLAVAKRLALCYHKQRQFDRAEEIYLRVFNACFHSLRVDDHCVLEAAVGLVEFYEEYHRHEKVIETYNRLLQHYRKNLKKDHQLTVQTLYKLAAVYLKLGRKEAYDCYHEIVTIYSHDGCVHAAGLDAAIIVLNHYHLEKRWSELQKICSSLWSTFTHHREIKFTEEMVELVYERYRYVLEYHAKTDFNFRYKLTIEYRDTVTKVFGASSAIVIKAMIALAEVCEGSEEHYQESVRIYEEVITRTKSTTVVTETTVKTMKKRLSKLYVTVVTTGKVSTTATVERAIAVSVEIYEQLRIEFGWWHETTLSKLKEITLLYKKLGTKESHLAIVQMLQASVMEIISTVTISTTLHSAATSLAQIYIASGMVRHGHDLVRQLRHVLLFPGFEGGEKDVSIKISRKTSKVSLVFLISFEQALNVDSKVSYSFSEIMADVLLETILYEQYMSVMSSFTENSNIEVVIEHAARLRFVWESRGRAGFVSVLDKKLFSLFTSRYAKFLGPATNNQAGSDFYVGLLREIGEGIAADRDSIDFGLVSCRAAYSVTKRFMEKEKDIPRAHEVAKVAFSFANSQNFYSAGRNYVWGYRLAELLAGINVDSWKSADNGTKEACLSTSRNIMQFVLTALKERKGFEFATSQPEDVRSLIYLLGEQKNYTELENLLTLLWQSREVQRTWYPDTVLNIGSLLVNAHISAGHLDQAITLCDTLYYNLRQSRGGLDAQALDFANRLCQLLRRGNRLRDAARVHQDVVGDLDEHLLATRGADKDERLRAAADAHLDGMRRCGWASRGDSVRTTRDVYGRLKGYGKLNTQPVENWAPLSAADEKREVNAAVNWQMEWKLNGPEISRPGMQKRPTIASAKERWRCWSYGSGVEVPTNQTVY